MIHGEHLNKKAETVHSNEETFSRALGLFVKYLERYAPPSRGRFTKLMVLATCLLAKNNPERRNEGFTSVEIVSMIENITGKKWSAAQEKESKTINHYYGKCEAFYQTISDGAYRFLHEHGVDVLPMVEKVKKGIGSGNYSLYSVRLIPFILDNPQEVERFREKAPENWARYYRCLKESDWRYYIAKSWKTQTTLALLIGCAVSLLFLTGAAITALRSNWMIYFYLTLYGCLFFLSMYTLVLPWIRLSSNNIAPLPWYLFADDDLLVELIPADGFKRMRLVKYKGKCPICGADVVVKPKGTLFFNRFHGICRNSPLEHVYSFDHVTMLGEPLRMKL